MNNSSDVSPVEDGTMSGTESTKTAMYQNLEMYALGYWHVHPYLSLIICTFGISTNLVNIVILTRKKMLNSINCVLTGIAISDIITMVDYIPYVIHFYLMTDIGDTPRRYTYTWSLYMAVHSCLSVVTHTISIWLAVCMSAMRYVFIRSRGNSKWNLDIGKTCLLVISVYCLSVLIFIPNYIVTEMKPVFLPKFNATIYKIKNLEIYLENTSTVNAINVWTFIVIGKLVPCCFISLFGGLLLRTLRESKKLSESLKQTSCSQRMKAHKRTTLMLLTIVLMFLIAELPSAILVFVCVFVKGFFMDYYLLFADTLDILSLTNNAVNFIMYCSMSRQFRECLCETLPQCKLIKADPRGAYHHPAPSPRPSPRTAATHV